MYKHGHGGTAQGQAGRARIRMQDFQSYAHPKDLFLVARIGLAPAPKAMHEQSCPVSRK